MTVRRRRTGIVLCGEIDGDVEGWRLQWERAPDASGSPDTGSAEVVDVLDAGERQLVDTEPSLIAGTAPSYWYRYRTVRGDCSTPGPWSVWIRARPDFFPDELPLCPGPAVGPPTAQLEQTSRTLLSETWDASGSPHPESEAGADGLQIRHRTRVEGRGWSAWGPTTSDGWTNAIPLSIRVRRDGQRRKFIQVEVRDTALRGSPVSEPRTVQIRSIVELLDLPTLGPGPLEEGFTRDGVGGEIFGRGRSSAPIFNKGRDIRRFEPIGGALENTSIFSSSFLKSGVRQSDGNRVGFVQKGHDGDVAEHGSGINFGGGAYQAIPQIDVGGGYITVDPSLANWPAKQVADVRPTNVTASGFTMHARVTELVGGVDQQQVPFSPATISGVGINANDYAAEMSDADDPSPAYDDQYTVVLNLSAQGETSFECPGQTLDDCQQTCNGGSITIGIYTRTPSGYALRATTGISADCEDESDFGREVNFSVSGLSPVAGAPECVTGVEQETGLGGSYTPQAWKWKTATPPDSTPATTSEYPARWTSRAKEDA